MSSITEKVLHHAGTAPRQKIPKKPINGSSAITAASTDFIGRAWCSPVSAEYTPTADPSTGDTLAEVKLSATPPYVTSTPPVAPRTKHPPALASTHRPRASFATPLRSRPASQKLIAPSPPFTKPWTTWQVHPRVAATSSTFHSIARHFYHHAGWALHWQI